MSHTEIGVALLGFGTVGSSVFDILGTKEGRACGMGGKHGCTFNVKTVLVRSPKKKRRIPLPARLIARDIQEILDDSSVDVVVEVMGGLDASRHYITEALKAKKHVITANKEVMGRYGNQIISRARQHGRFLGFSAAVTGCHHFCSVIHDSVMIRSIAGIFNSTSNYILSAMENGLEFKDALAQAQEKGYAEADPSDDIGGRDTVNKLVILSALAFGRFLNRQKVKRIGIVGVSRFDIESAGKMGYAIRLIGKAELRRNDRIEAWVRPCLVPRASLFAQIRGIENAIEVDDILRGPSEMVAEGAGGKATAMAIISDLLNVARGSSIIWPSACLSGRDVKYASYNRAANKYFLRLKARNKPGVLAGVAKALSRQHINITDVTQHNGAKGTTVPLVLMCGPCRENALRKSVLEMKKQGIGSKNVQFLNVLDTADLPMA